jgi:signal transduction histidine kinase
VTARLDLIRRDGRRMPFEIRASGFERDGVFAGIHGSARDVSEQDRLERDLRRQAVEIAASDERAHLARELHDSVTQALFSMTLLTRSVELLLTKDPGAAVSHLATLRDLQRDALAEMRALIFELRPGGLEQDGLVPALRRHTAAVQGRIGLPVVLEADLEGRLPAEVEDALYRIAQEALHNVVKHAGAKTVRLTVARIDHSVRLAVIDDGAGFDASSIPPGHLGLAGMRARAEKIGGHLTVDSQPGRGTTIEAIVPAGERSADEPPAGEAQPADDPGSADESAAAAEEAAART